MRDSGDISLSFPDSPADLSQLFRHPDRIPRKIAHIAFDPKQYNTHAYLALGSGIEVEVGLAGFLQQEKGV
jgi:hypothetical protein